MGKKKNHKQIRSCETNHLHSGLQNVNTLLVRKENKAKEEEHEQKRREAMQRLAPNDVEVKEM